MALLSENELAELTKKSRETVRRKLSCVPNKPGPHRARMYESHVALEVLYGIDKKDGGDFVTASEAQRLLTISKRQQIDLEMEVTRKERPHLEDVTIINEMALGNMAGLLKSHTGKSLTEELINDIFTEARTIGEKLGVAA